MTAKLTHLGYEVGSGQAVAIPLKNLVCVGQTQESGKTTSLEALIHRAGVPAVAFVTKRGEGSFAEGRRIPPYFRDRADWQFVDQLLEAQLREKNKFLRPWIIRLCRTTKTLADVQARVKQGLVKAKGISEGVYTQLDAYLDLIVPEIARAHLAPSIRLEPGLNVMDVSSYPIPMQMLFVQSAIDWVKEHERGVVTIVPEAWQFIPETRGSPVKASAVELVRQGSGIGNYIWVDSQDTAGVDKVILRGCPVWLIGVQREANEIKRNLANIPAGIRRPKPQDIAHLSRGQFYACWQDQTVKVYVRPAWMKEGDAQAIARGQRSIDRVQRPTPRTKPTEEAMESKAIEAKLDTLIGLMTKEATPAPQPVVTPPRRPPEPVPANGPPLAGDEETLYQRFKARLVAEAPSVLRLLTTQPELQVEIEKHVVKISETSPEGRIAKLIAEGFFQDRVSEPAVFAELLRRGHVTMKTPKIRVHDPLKRLVKKGFLTREGDGYQAVRGMEVNLVEKD